MTFWHIYQEFANNVPGDQGLVENVDNRGQTVLTVTSSVLPGASDQSACIKKVLDNVRNQNNLFGNAVLRKIFT